MTLDMSLVLVTRFGALNSLEELKSSPHSDTRLFLSPSALAEVGIHLHQHIDFGPYSLRAD